MTTTHAHAKVSPDAYLPMMGKVVEVREMTARENYFRLELPRPLGHRPGQFVMVSVLGIGEAPISISNGPTSTNTLELVIRRAGRLTQVLSEMKPGDLMGIRGPFGSGFDLSWFDGKEILIVAGGLGLVPLRSLIQPLVANADKYPSITLLSGCRNPAEELYREEVREWAKHPKLRVIRLVDGTENMPWDGEVGLVTAPIPKLDIKPDRTIAVLCGPPVMYKFVILGLNQKNLPHERIFVDLERRMKCGVGKCGHCQINDVYCCQDGPVFRFSEIEHLPEALL